MENGPQYFKRYKIMIRLLEQLLLSFALAEKPKFFLEKKGTFNPDRCSGDEIINKMANVVANRQECLRRRKLTWLMGF